PISAVTGFGLDALRTELGSLLASLWVDIDLDLPYAAGDLLARVRERGSVDIDYRGDGVHISGRVAPALAGELEADAARAARA
ncbi:MAG: GTPase HflX, partial [Candidatus Limnocylindrales bacterium]